MTGLDGFVELFGDAMRNLGYAPPLELELTTQQKSELAIERAGTADKKSRAYKSARRTIERRSTQSGERRGQTNRRFADLVRRRGLRVFIQMELDPSPSGEEDMRDRTIDLELTGDQLGQTAAALERGSLTAAGQAFKVELMRAYEEVEPGEPSFLARAQIGEIEAMDIGWGGGT